MIIYEKNCLINITTNTNIERKQINESQAFYIYKAPKYQKKRKKKSEEQYKKKHQKRHDLV